MAILKLSLLGPFSAALGDKPLYKFRTNKAQALFSYLAVETGQAHRRDSLMALLWPGLQQTSAQVNLRQTLYRLRQAIPQVSARGRDELIPLILSDRQTIQINPEADIRLDVARFTELLDENPAQAAELYRGDFLADFSLYDSSTFEDWTTATRESLRRQALGVLDDLASEHLAEGAYDQAQAYAWRQLEIDDLNERALRQLMRALTGSKQRNAALSQYHHFRKRLEKELGLEPTPETTALYEKIQADALPQAPQPRAAKKGLAVFLLTNIEGAASLWKNNRQAMMQALQTHNTILVQHITQSGGRVLEMRGDGIRAVFEGANPLPCVLAIQQEFGKMDWGAIGELRIRIGLHGIAGDRKVDAHASEEDAYFGPVILKTIRIVQASWGGQILCSPIIFQTFSLPPGARWQDFGAHQLEGLPESHRIYGLLHPDLPHQSFPPLQTLPTQPQPQAPAAGAQPPHNLRRRPTAFIGRETELRKLDGLVDDHDVRLVTIVGPGGWGKTRLAHAVAERQLSRRANGTQPPTESAPYLFPHGVFFVSLASLSAEAQIIPTLAEALQISLNVQENGGGAAIERVLDHLHSRQMLLVLDNFEHLLDCADIVPEILQAAPRVMLLVTSRERLNVREESVFPIQGLVFPPPEMAADASEYTAVKLFVQSARRVQPDFELTPAAGVALARICQMVEGMPLALELAASWVDMLPLHDIAAEIQRSFDILETDVRNVPERHRSIRVVFDYAWQALNQIEQRAFSRLSVFHEGFTREAAYRVAGATIRTLAKFVSKSLLQYNQVTDRYQIHALLRQYGQEKLAALPEAEAEARTRHCAYYTSVLEQRGHIFKAGQVQTAIQDIETDLANMNAAWQWAVSQPDLARIAQALPGLSLFYSWNNRLSEGRAVCQAVVDRLAEFEPEDAPAHLYQSVLARALAWLALFMRGVRSHGQVGLLLARSMALVDKLTAAGHDRRDIRAFVLYLQGFHALRSNKPEEARKQLLESLSLGQEMSNLWLVSNAFFSLGDLAHVGGNYAESRRWREKSLALAQQQQSPWIEVRAMTALGWVARNMVEYDEAIHWYTKSQALSKAHSDPLGIMGALDSLAYLSMFQGRFEDACRFLQESTHISQSARMLYAPAKMGNLGVAYYLDGAFEQAREAIESALALAKEAEQSQYRLFPTVFYAELLALEGRYPEALAQAQLARTWAVEIDPFFTGRIFRALGWLALANENYQAAHEHFTESIAQYRILVDDEQVAWSTVGLGYAALGLNKMDKAQEHLTDALWTSIEIQAFIPLLFAVPMAARLLAAQGEHEQAASIYQQASRFRLVAGAKLFADLVGQHIPAAASPPPTAPPADENELRRALWATGAQLLANWLQQWKEDAPGEKTRTANK